MSMFLETIGILLVIAGAILVFALKEITDIQIGVIICAFCFGSAFIGLGWIAAKVKKIQAEQQEFFSEILDKYRRSYNHKDKMHESYVDTLGFSRKTKSIQPTANDARIKKKKSTPAFFKTLQVKNTTIHMADYWKEWSREKDCLSYYAEGCAFEDVTLSVEFVVDDDEDSYVSFDSLYADNMNMIKSIERAYSNAEVLSDGVFESKYGVKGILYTFSLQHITDGRDSETAEGYCFVFPSESDRRWFYITLIVVNSESDGSYLEDYMKTLASIYCE